MGSPCKPKSFNFPLLLDITPTKKLSTLLEKKVSRIAFKQVLPKILCATCIFSQEIMSYLKKLIGTVSLDTKHCPAGLPSRIIPH